MFSCKTMKISTFFGRKKKKSPYMELSEQKIMKKVFMENGGYISQLLKNIYSTDVVKSPTNLAIPESYPSLILS